MKVGQHGIDTLEPVAGRDKQVGLAPARARLRRLRHGRLQGAHHGCADGHDPTAALPGRGDPVAGGGASTSQVLVVHDMVFEGVGAHRLEGARTHMQGDEGLYRRRAVPGRPSVAFIKVQAGGGRRDRAGILCA